VDAFTVTVGAVTVIDDAFTSKLPGVSIDTPLVESLTVLPAALSVISPPFASVSVADTASFGSWISTFSWPWFSSTIAIRVPFLPVSVQRSTALPG